MKKKAQITDEARKQWIEFITELLTDADCPSTPEQVFSELGIDCNSEEEEFPIDRTTLRMLIAEAVRKQSAAAADNWREHFEAGEVDDGPPVWLIEDWSTLHRLFAHFEQNLGRKYLLYQ